MDRIRKSELCKLKVKQARPGRPTQTKSATKIFCAPTTAVLVEVAPRVIKYLRRSYATQDIDDALQTAMLRILNAYENVYLETSSRVYSLLLTVTRNLLKNQYQDRKAKREKTPLLTIYYISRFETQNPLESLLYKNRPSIMQLAKERLPHKQFECIEAIITREEPGSKIARELGISTDTFKANYRHGMLRLRKIIKDENLQDRYKL